MDIGIGMGTIPSSAISASTKATVHAIEQYSLMAASRQQAGIRAEFVRTDAMCRQGSNDAYTLLLAV
jgi:precorrin-6B methylase 2